MSVVGLLGSRNKTNSIDQDVTITGDMTGTSVVVQMRTGGGKLEMSEIQVTCQGRP